MSATTALVLAGLLPVVFSAGFYLLEKKTSFARLPYLARQAVIGLLFGALAIFSTEFGIDVGGASINVRDAAPLTAGLIFGAPAGIIAGIIGGVERWLAPLWGVGEYTRVACSLATVLAGFIGALARKLLFDDKKPSWFHGLAIGMTAEVLHMLLVFLTNMSDIHRAFVVVQQCAGIMVLCNSLSVMLAVLAVSWLGKEKTGAPRGAKKISQSFQRWLLVCVVAAFAITSLFTWALQTRITETDTEDLLRINAQDVRDDINDASDANLLSLTKAIAAQLPTSGENGSQTLAELAERYDVAEINVVSSDGIITASTAAEFLGYDMASGEQSAFFLPLLSGTQSLVQSYQPIAYNETISRKYAGVALPGGGFLQVGYDAERFQRDIDEQVVSAAKNRHIGQNGYIIICNEDWVIISDPDGHEGESLSDTGLRIEAGAPESTSFLCDVHGVPCYCAYTLSEGYYIISVLPRAEAVFSRDIAVYITAFMEIVVFAALFTHIYFLIKKLIVDNIRRINSHLAEITGGNLDVTVNVRSNEEFASLSDDINATVATLKTYIAEAAARIDKELEFARAIQHSALPSVFPPYPGRSDFDIYALMDSAKEVGGDFYDFYLIGSKTLVFLIADVSGKGIPAAMFMMRAKTLLKGLAESGLEVDEIFSGANEKLCEGNDAGMFVTAWMGILDFRTGLLRYANAGHNPPAICRSGGSFEYLRGKPNFILAGMNGVKYTKYETHLLPGDVLYLYTDGVTEATDASNILFGEERLLQGLGEHPLADMQTLCSDVKRAVDSFVDKAPQFDDITMLALKLNYLQSGDTITTVPAHESAALISDFADARLASLDIPPKTANKLRIAIDEIYTNICSYSGAATSQLTLSEDNGAVTLCFRDDGKPYNPLAEKDPDVSASAEERQAGGLGIFMVKKLMDSSAYKYANGYNTLTLTLSSQQTE